MTGRDIHEGVDDGLMPASNTGGERYNPSKPVKPLDINLYATKKTVAQGMMDIALLTANANQLRYVLESGSRSVYFYISVTLISISIILQLTIGVTIIFLGRFNLNNASNTNKAERLNNIVILGIFMITSVNVINSGFGIDASEKIDPMKLATAVLDSYRRENSEIEPLT